MKKIIILLLLTLLTKVVAHESCQRYSVANKYDQYDYLVELIRHSTFPFDKWDIKLKDVTLIIDNDDKESISVLLKDATSEPFTSGTLGWVRYDKKSGKLFDESAHLEHPVELQYDVGWYDVMQTIFSDREQHYLYIKAKSFLYFNTSEVSKSKKFLIKDDCALILNGSKDGWYHIYFLHSKWGTQTIMWIKKSDKVEVVK